MDLEWHFVGFLLIVLLEVFAALVLVGKLTLFLWRKNWRSLAHQLKKGLKLLAFTGVDPAAAEKFQRIQCRVVIEGSRVFLLALFPRMFAIQTAMYSGAEHSLQNSLDPSNILSAYVCMLTVMCQNYLTPRILDAWFVVMHFTCFWPILLAAPENVRDVTYIILLPSFMIGLCSKRIWLPVVGNLLNCVVAAYRVISTAEVVSSTDVLSYAATFWLITGAVYAIRAQMLQNVNMGLRLKVRTIDLEAVSALLLGLCDAVVETDDKLYLTEDSRQLSTMLLQGQGTRGDLAGRDLLSFFCAEDKEHIRQSFKATSNATQTTALNARMYDSLGNTLRVELLHIQFNNLAGELCHLVGMREFQDVASTVPLLDDDRMSIGCGSMTFDTAMQEILRKADTSLMFDASSFDILTVSEGFTNFSRALGQEESFEGLSVFNLSADGPESFSCRMQDAVNAFDETSSCQEAIFLRKVELFGAEVSVVVTFQQDKLLDSLVGNVVIVCDLELQSEMRTAHQNIMKRVPSGSSTGSRRRVPATRLGL